MTQTHTGVDYLGKHGMRWLANVVFDSCTFSNCSIRGGTFTDVQFRNCRVWSCSLRDVEMRNCVVDGMRMTVGGGSGGRTSPLFLWGMLADRLILRGTFGGLIWNPPDSAASSLPGQGATEIGATFYAGVEDYALDIRHAQFTAVPSLRFGPPGHLIRRDPETQPLIQREEAQRVLALPDLAIGVWRIVLEDLVRTGWPDSMVLVPANKSPKKLRERNAAYLDRLREVADLQ